MRRRRWVPPECVCEMYEGRPGSGKSFILLTRLLEFILEEKRPVYTNLPLNFRVVRQYLRNRKGEAYAGLIRPLTYEHFVAFMDRTVTRSRERDEAQRDAARSGRPWSEDAFARAFHERHGETVYDGREGSNWIAEGAVIIIDECHHWFPMRDQKNEPRCLQSYLTMHRHHLHSLLWATQNRMQVTITVRRLCSAFWHVRNKGEDKVAFGIQLKHFGFSAFAYAKFSPEAEDAVDKEGSAPIEGRVVYPWLRSESWKFRLYRSFTHVGSRRSMKRAMDRVRADAGIDGDGALILTDEEVEQMEKERRMKRPKLLKGLGRLAVLGTVCALFTGVGFGFGRSTALRAINDAIPVVENTWYDGLTLDAVGSKAAFFSGKRVGLEERVAYGGQLLACDARARSVAIAADGDVWVWRVGTERPFRLGNPDSVLARLRAYEADSGRAVGSPLAPDARAGARDLGPAPD